MDSLFGKTGKYCAGAILPLLALVVLGITTTALEVAGQSLSWLDEEDESATSLGRAREALLGYAVRDTTRPGELPCPDINHDGILLIIGANRDYSGSRCRSEVAGVVQPGWLAWRTLGLAPERDQSGATLWYIVSPDHHAGAAAPLTSDTPGRLRLIRRNGEVVEDLVALLIAPGAALDTTDPPQSPRPSIAHDALTQRGYWLEGENSDGDLTFGEGEGNDQLLAISREQLIGLIERRITGEVIALLEEYRAICGGYPAAAPFSLDSSEPLHSSGGLREGWLPLDGAAPYDWGETCPGGTAPNPPSYLNDWGRLIYFAYAGPFSVGGSGICNGNCLTLRNSIESDREVALVVIAIGRQLNGSSRTIGNYADHMEGENATPGDDIFEQRRDDPLFNDRLRSVEP